MAGDATQAQAYILVSQFKVRIGELEAENKRLLAALEEIRDSRPLGRDGWGCFYDCQRIARQASKPRAVSG